jgi:serine protease inhibitor
MHFFQAVRDVGSAFDPEVFEFTVDRPFLFLLKNSDFIFFMGRVVKPEY